MTKYVPPNRRSGFIPLLRTNRSHQPEPEPEPEADINYFLLLELEFVKFILNQLGYEEVGRAACVCREFYKELTPRAKTIAHTIKSVEKFVSLTSRSISWAYVFTKKKWGDPAMTSLTTLSLRNSQITDLTPLSALTSLNKLHLTSNQITDLAPLSALTKPGVEPYDFCGHHMVPPWSCQINYHIIVCHY
eukprot:SAG22_NODE_1470_length_4346_cov_26.858724_2_plen_190_part_00